MSEYGMLTEGDELLEQAMELPSTVVRDAPDPVNEPWEVMEIGMRRLKMRLEGAVKFVEAAAAANGPCRCAYAPDPHCIPCMAKRILTAWQQEDAGIPGTPGDVL